MEIKYLLQPSTEETALKAEYLRYEAYGIKAQREDLDDYFIEEITSGRMLIFTCEIDSLTVAVSYISDFSNSIFVDYLFVLPEYREKGLQLGRNLLLYILNNKELLENYYKKQFHQSKLSPTSEKSKSLYLKIGYQESNDNLDILVKKI